MRITVFLIVSSLLLSCGTSNSRQDVNENLDKELSPTNDTLEKFDVSTKTVLGTTEEILNCCTTDSIIEILSKYLESRRVREIDPLAFYRLLSVNHDDLTQCHFPRRNSEIDLMNEFVLALFSSEDIGDNELIVLFYVFDACRRNIELVEYIQSRFASIIVINFEKFFNMLTNLDSNQRKRAIGLIEFIYSVDDLQKLKVDVTSINQTTNNEILSDVLNMINEEIARK